MAGVNANKVYMPTPDQSATTGAVATAPTSTAAPTDAVTALPNTWASGGYIDENGISLGVTRSVTAIKDWSQATVRNALSDFNATITLNFMQMDEFAAQEMLGASNVTKTAATQTKGELLKLSIGSELPPVKSWCFSMKDGDRRVRVYIPRGQITELNGDITFVPSAVNVWGCTLATYDDGTGHSLYVFYDDGQTLSA